MMGGNLSAGCAVADITPPTGIDLGGYWERVSGVRSVHDALAVKALVFADGYHRIGLIALDLVGLDRCMVEEIRDRAEDALGLRSTALMICCSHTHSGPLTLSFRGMGCVDHRYLASLKATVVETLAAAAERLAPATVSHAEARVDIGRNRRRPNAARPGKAHVVRVEGGGGPIATVFTYGCHPVVLGQDNYAISSDFTGVAARYLESSTGCPALFLNGACGDVNPESINADFDEAERLGSTLGRVVERAWERAAPLSDGEVGSFSERVRLPLLEGSGTMAAHLAHLILGIKSALRRLSSADGSRRVQEARLNWSREYLAWLRDGDRPADQFLEVQGLGIGRLRILGIEGEPFSAYQQIIEGERVEPTALCGLANGSIGYLPTADDYRMGGYEIDEAYKVYPSVRMVAPECERLIRRAAKNVLDELDGNLRGGRGSGAVSSL